MITFVSPAYPPPDGSFTLRTMSDITDLAVHHTAGPVDQTPLEIDAFERSRPDGDIFMPYTWLIGPDGTIYNGRPPLAVSAATYGRNRQSVAVCVIGNFQSGYPGYTGPPTDAQLKSLLSLGIWAHRQFPYIDQTYAHGDVGYLFYRNNSSPYATACCGTELRRLLPGIKNNIAAALSHG